MAKLRISLMLDEGETEASVSVAGNTLTAENGSCVIDAKELQTAAPEAKQQEETQQQ